MTTQTRRLVNDKMGRLVEKGRVFVYASSAVSLLLAECREAGIAVTCNVDPRGGYWIMVE